MIRRHLLALLVAASLAACTPSTPMRLGADAPEQAADHRFDALRSDPPLVTAFLRRMPKGGDLHDHLTGAIYAESYLRWAAEDGLCIDAQALALAAIPRGKASCAAAGLVPAAQAETHAALYAALVDALSMRDFVPGAHSGHDHFFDTFGKFAAATGNTGAMLAELADRAAAENTLYLELMTGVGMGAARTLAEGVAWDEDLAALRDRLFAKGLLAIMPDARRDIDAAEREMQRQLGCGGAAARPGCGTTIRYLAAAIRTVPPAQVFAQLLLGFALAQSDSRIVGINLVAPEDDRVALADYRLQMRMLQFLHRAAPEVKIALHAGELTLGLVPPEDLRFHIRAAVETAGARRIGHGVDLAYEDDATGLLAEMAQRQVAVEINLTSNAMILGVVGERHPFPVYRRAGVPTVISTDDAGVERIDLTHEYQRAATTYGLGYAELKTLARNSLEYSFLPGASLWRSANPYAPVAGCAADRLGAPEPSSACRAHVGASERARLQWRLEAAFTAFEAQP